MNTKQKHQFDEMEACRFVTRLQHAKVTRIGNQIDGTGGQRIKGVIQKIDAGDEAGRSGRSGVKDTGAFQQPLPMFLSKSGRYLPLAKVPGIPKVMIVEKRHRPWSGVREEGTVQLQLLLVSIRVLRQQRVEIPIGPQCRGMQELDGVRTTLDPMIEVQLQFAAGSQQIFLCHVEVIGGDTAIVGEVAVDVGGPRVLRHHPDVNQAVVWWIRGDRGTLQKIELAEISLRFLQLRRLDRIAFFEKQETAKEGHPRPHRQDVRPSIKAAVLCFLGAEEGNGVDADRPDAKRRRSGEGEHHVQCQSQHAGTLRSVR